MSLWSMAEWVYSKQSRIWRWYHVALLKSKTDDSLKDGVFRFSKCPGSAQGVPRDFPGCTGHRLSCTACCLWLVGALVRQRTQTCCSLFTSSLGPKAA